jgi:hypothetical protein
LFFLCLQAIVEGLLGGGALGDVANDFISSELPNLVEQNKGLVLPQLEAAIKEKANPVLGCLTFDDFLNLINNPPPPPKKKGINAIKRTSENIPRKTKTLISINMFFKKQITFLKKKLLNCVTNFHCITKSELKVK